MASMNNDDGNEPLLEVRDLDVEVPSGRGHVLAVDDLSFAVRSRESVGLVGESGSGKSLTLRAILGLLPPRTRIVRGQVSFSGTDLRAMGKREMCKVRGRGIGMVFQEPMTALNPVVRVGEQISDAARRSLKLSHREARSHAVEIMKHMGIPDAESRYDVYPHELSGGLRQRIMIAAALVSRPRLLFCDEPTTALDVTIQDQIIKLLRHLRDETAMSLVYVTHDLAVVTQLCERIEVMYAGRILESGATEEIFQRPRHPYTLGLLKSVPRIEVPQASLSAIPGSAPTPSSRPSGCPFHPRCHFGGPECWQGAFPLRMVQPGHASACIHDDRCADEATRELVIL